MLPQSDRMGARFKGARIEHTRGHDIISDGVALGGIQVIGDGQPIVLLADRQSAGGYTKIGTVCSFHIGRIGQLKPGQRLRFRRVTVAEAHARSPHSAPAWRRRSRNAGRREEERAMTLEHAITDYQAKTPRSRQLFEDALRVMPGGNSRTTTFFDPYPFYIARGEGARIWDADGNERLDFNCNYTSLILGHANPAVVKAIQDAAVHGMSFPGPASTRSGSPSILTKRIPGMEVVRFANSGTEATMHAMRVARAFTGRSKIAKFEGAYHGTHDWVLVSVAPPRATAGSRKRPKSVAWSAGVPRAVLKHVVVLPWNDLGRLREDPREAGE